MDALTRYPFTPLGETPAETPPPSVYIRLSQEAERADAAERALTAVTQTLGARIMEERARADAAERDARAAREERDAAIRAFERIQDAAAAGRACRGSEAR